MQKSRKVFLITKDIQLKILGVPPFFEDIGTS